MAATIESGSATAGLDTYDAASGTVFFRGRKPISAARVLAVARAIRAADAADAARPGVA
jgi:hypothetical protein